MRIKNTDNNKYQQPLNDWFIILNGHECKCCKSISIQLSPIIQNFYKKKKNKNLFFVTDISIDQLDLNSTTNSLNSICSMITRIFNGEEIICQADNISDLLLIGKHFQIQGILNKVEKYQQYYQIFEINFQENLDFQDMVKLERIFLLEIDENNIEAKIKEYEQMFKKIPISCIIQYTINVGSKNFNVRNADPNEFVIEIIKNVDRVVPDTLSQFITIIFNKFIHINSNFLHEKDKINKKIINSLICHMFASNLMMFFNKNIQLTKYDITIPDELKGYFKKKDEFYEIVNQNYLQNKNSVIDHNDSLLSAIKNDNIDSFQELVISSQIDIDCTIKNNIINRISFIIGNKECSLIEISAFLGSLKCFTFLYAKHAKINKSSLSNYAVAGGNSEIIHFCEREECIFNETTLEISIDYHKHQITKWLINTKKILFNERNLKNCILNYNIKTMRFLFKKGINMSHIVFYICESSNTLLFKWYTDVAINNSLELIFQNNNESALHIACEQNNEEIVKSLLSIGKIDINHIIEVIFRKTMFL